jgi:hypothetical protein
MIPLYQELKFAQNDQEKRVNVREIAVAKNASIATEGYFEFKQV